MNAIHLHQQRPEYEIERVNRAENKMSALAGLVVGGLLGVGATLLVPYAAAKVRGKADESKTAQNDRSPRSPGKPHGPESSKSK